MFLWLSLSLTFTISGNTRKVWYTTHRQWHTWNLSDIVLIGRLRFKVWRDKMKEINSNLHHISRIHIVNMTYDCGCWPWSPGWGTVYQVSSTIKLLFPSFFILCSLEGSHYAPTALKPISLRAEYLHKLLGILMHGQFVCSLPFH